MASDIRTVAKDFNRDLLFEQLAASVLPFVSAFMAGFERLNRFVGTPSAAPRLITKDGVAGTSDFAQPGEIRFEFSTVLTGPQGAILDALLNVHDATEHTAGQDRNRQDVSDYAALESNWPNIDTMTNAQLRTYISTLARVVIREKRDANI
jgi:hypothetical protein